MVLLWYLIGLVVACAAAWFLGRLSRKCALSAEEFAYCNVLDQIGEDLRINVLINSAAIRAVFEYKSIENMTIDSFLFVVMKTVNYKIFDSYTAKYKDVDIKGLIRRKFNDLINDNK